MLRIPWNDLVFPDFGNYNFPAINEKDIVLHEIKFMFTNIRADQVKRLLEVLESQKVDLKNTGIINIEFREFIKTLTALKKVEKIKSNTVAFLRMIEIAEEYIEKKDLE